MKTLHLENCEAPLCNDDPEGSATARWYPGEPVCGRRPFTTGQKRQARLNRLLTSGKLKHKGCCYFTGKELSELGRAANGTTGTNPDTLNRCLSGK